MINFVSINILLVAFSILEKEVFTVIKLRSVWGTSCKCLAQQVRDDFFL
jgi:hypothetical protein